MSSPKSLVLALHLVFVALAPTAAADDLLLTGARVLNAEGTGWLDDVAVLVSDGRIAQVAALTEIRVTAGTRQLELHGLHLLPGLIDLHTHLLLHPYDEANWNDQVLVESLGLRTARAVAAAEATLHAGFTTIRELGTEGAGYADVGLRDAIGAGIVPGPRVLAATRALVATGSYGPSGFDPRWALPKGAQVCDGVDGVRVAVREQIAAGADWIKVYADSRRRPGDPSTPTFSREELLAIVDEATAAGLPVAAHAFTDEAITRAVLAGVQTIEHGNEAGPRALELMALKGVVLCPTLGAQEAMALYSGWDGGADGAAAPLRDEDPRRLHVARESFEVALQVGVTLACGSDAGVFDHGDNARELELMAAWGMAPEAVLASATRVAADVLGRSDLGRIAPGAVGDLVVVSGDPLADFANLREPAVVIQAGVVVVDRRSSADAATRAELVALSQRVLDLLGEKRFEELAALFAPGAIEAMDIQEHDVQRVVSAEESLARAERSLAEIESFREWLSGEATVRIDGKLALVWAPFLLEADGARSTGVDVFQWLKLEGEWKLVSLAFTNRPLPPGQERADPDGAR